MKRKIIKINEDLCNGCGECVTDCAEGALKIVDGKAKLIKEDYCDGLGACLKGCPTGALTIVEEEARPFDEEAVKVHLSSMKKTPHSHGHSHGHAGCPSSLSRDLSKGKIQTPAHNIGPGMKAITSELTQWPVQLHLVSPSSPFFNDKELVVLSTCSPIASADIHWRFLRGRSVVVLCPKLDRTEPYIEKLASILSNPSIPKVLPVIMEVPCCKGLSHIVSQAIKLSGREDLKMEEHIIALDGTMLN